MREIVSNSEIQPIHKIPHWQFYICTCKEFDIEKFNKNQGTVEALIWIDKQIKNGSYESEREKLVSKWAATFRSQDNLDITSTRGRIAKLGRQHIEARIELGLHRNRLFEAKNSPLTSERKEFASALKALAEIESIGGGAMLLPILRLVPSPKKPKGRNERRYPTNLDHSKLDSMRILIFSGLTSSGAAKKISMDVPIQNQIATQKRLERWWRWKMNLRKH